MAAGFTGLINLLEKQQTSDVNEMMYLLLGASWREFEEVLVLAQNGYGSGGMKLLRALYERTVTAQYLMKHPDKVKQFKDFTHVHWHKLLLDAYQSGIGAKLPKERREEIENNFKAVEGQFTEVACKPCNKNRLQGSWTKKPIPTQAREIHEQLGHICFQSYLMPTFFLHTTDWGIKKQMTARADGTRELHADGAESFYAERAIVFGATLMTHLADGIAQFYSFGESERKTIEDAVGAITQDLIGNIGMEEEQEPETI